MRDLDIDELVDLALPRKRTRDGASAPTFLREIQEEDFVILNSSRELTADSRPLVKVRNTHHLAARSLAEGKKDVEVSLITGYTPARIGQLKDDPSFQELLAYYKSQVESKWLSVQERLASIGLAVSEEMMSRFEEDPSRFSNEELRRWFETTMDRSGNGPSATRNVNIQSKNASLLLIEKIKRETEDSSQVRQIAAE